MMLLDFSHKTHQKPPFIQVSIYKVKENPVVPNPEHRVPGVCQECFQGIQEIPQGRSEPGGCLAQGW